MQLSYKAPCVELTKIENLWFQLTNVACNIKCKHCYLDCHQDNRKKNFLDIGKIQNTLQMKFDDLKMIYLTGGEPFLHPKINDILKLVLNESDVTICSNGTLINEKKIKVIKSIEDNSPYKLNFKLSLDHFTEGRNDEYRASGVFKKVINALLLAQKFNINANVTCVNLKNEPEELLKEGFLSLFEKSGLYLSEKNLKIIPMLKMGTYAKYYTITDVPKAVTFENIRKFDLDILDCKNSRVITSDGIYSCPALVSDPRGKLGESLDKSENTVYLETQTCFDCISRRDGLFS